MLVGCYRVKGLILGLYLLVILIFFFFSFYSPLLLKFACKTNFIINKLENWKTSYDRSKCYKCASKAGRAWHMPGTCRSWYMYGTSHARVGLRVARPTCHPRGEINKISFTNPKSKNLKTFLKNIRNIMEQSDHNLFCGIKIWVWTSKKNCRMQDWYKWASKAYAKINYSRRKS